MHYLRGDVAAIAVLQRAVDAAPDVPGYRTRLGLAQVRAGLRDDARANLQKAVAARRDFPRRPRPRPRFRSWALRIDIAAFSGQ